MGQKTVAHRVIGGAFSALGVLFASAVPGYGDPIPLRPPLPDGLVMPKPLSPILDIGANQPDAPAFCVFFDIGEDGRVSNLEVRQITGIPEKDEAILKWWSNRRWEPATLNGKKQAVRMLGQYSLGKLPRKNGCSWDMASNQPAQP